MSLLSNTGSMETIDDLLRQLQEAHDLQSFRRSIITVMLTHLRALPTESKAWNKAHYANAIAALAMNINAIKQPTDAWLRLCLVDLQNAIESAQSTPLSAPHVDPQDTVTLNELIAIVEALYDRT